MYTLYIWPFVRALQRCSVPAFVVQVLLDEGHSMTHMVHIWQLIVRHADLFYASR